MSKLDISKFKVAINSHHLTEALKGRWFMLRL